MQDRSNNDVNSWTLLCRVTGALPDDGSDDDDYDDDEEEDHDDAYFLRTGRYIVKCDTEIRNWPGD